MFILDDPYASTYLLETLSELDMPVLDTEPARRLAGDTGLNFVDRETFAARLRAGEKVLSNSENGLEHLLACGCSPDLSRQIDICKDKALFRETVADLHPGYRFRRVSFDDLEKFDVSAMPCPCVVKPARGFFSLGVHLVDDPSKWPDTVARIKGEHAALNREYPQGVVDSTEYIVEQTIDGEEYAIDLFYDGDGKPVITNILHHRFLSAADISDRLYYTSTGVLKTWLLPFTEYLAEVGKACSFKDFAAHVEVRVTDHGDILPIEANPLRFAGWCVCDITRKAWGFNPYECYLEGLRPDWDAILHEVPEDMVTAMVIGDFSGDLDRSKIRGIDFDSFKLMFSNILELREIDYVKYPVFTFAFARMDEAELEALPPKLTRDFSVFLKLD